LASKGERDLTFPATRAASTELNIDRTSPAWGFCFAGGVSIRASLADVLFDLWGTSWQRPMELKRTKVINVLMVIFKVSQKGVKVNVAVKQGLSSLKRNSGTAVHRPSTLSARQCRRL
jgi:hypothetical protein